jgi:N-acetylmuramoyl-L-alanine amidase
MNKKTSVILMGALVATLSIFTANTYIGGNLRTTSNGTYSINQDILRDENLEIIQSINNSMATNTLKNETQDANLVAENTQKDKKSEKLVLSRGGSGLNVVKSKSKTQLKTQNKTSTGKSVLSYSEKDLFYRLVSSEAAGETFAGQLAVATVIMNRVKSPDFPNTITSVILDKTGGYQQFTPVLDGRINLPPTNEAKKAVDMVLNGSRSFGSNIMYFVNPQKAESNRQSR